MNEIADKIRWRFLQDVEHIERYVRLIRAKSTLHDRQVRDLNGILQSVEIERLPVRDYDRARKPYSSEEIADLLAAIRKVEPEVYQTILGHEQGIDDYPPIPTDGPASDAPSKFYEWVDYLAEHLSDEPENGEIEAVINRAVQEAQAVDEELDEDERISPSDLRELLKVAVAHALHARFARRLDALIYAKEQFEEIEVLARTADPHAEINVLRQGFILLTTAFDAVVFDLTRLAFRKRFFQLVGIFGKQEKVSLETLGEMGSFEAFGEKIIEEQLKKRYVKDLLMLLQGLGVALVDEERGDNSVQLLELVLRRNVHVHNRGIVDERYLELDSKSGKPRYNLFDLQLGQQATITDEYFKAALRLCDGCVDRLVDWVKKEP